MPEGHLKLPQSLNEARPALARWVAALGLVALCRILGIDIPDWSLFVLFSAPAALSLCAAVTFAAVHARHSHGQGVPENAASADLMSFPILGSAGFGRSARMR
jgi:hypothetical protein